MPALPALPSRAATSPAVCVPPTVPLKPVRSSYIAEGEAEATKIRTQTDYEISVSISEAKAQAEATVAEGEAEYMRTLSAVYADESRSDFYTFVLSLDAAKASLTGENKTLILDDDSPVAQIFYSIE